jgi:hypothetical protein
MTSPVTEDVRIYLAARFNGGRADPRSGNPHQIAAASEPYPYHLESFHYVGNGKKDESIRYTGHKIFMDSGAFSMFTLGSEVSLDEYGQFLATRSDYIEIASNVDAIGAGREQDSYNNQKILESMRLPVTVCPVHHARDDDRWLVKYLDEGYDYIFLGGMVPESTPYLLGWLDHIWDKYLALPDGTARVKIHGFGLTTLELMERYPWYSVDSTSWVQIGMFGGLYMNVGGRVRNLSISEHSPAAKQFGKSFWSLDPISRAHIEAEFEREGFTAKDLSESYGWRDKWNIRFFRRHMQGLRPVFKRSQVTFF